MITTTILDIVLSILDIVKHVLNILTSYILYNIISL